MVEFIDRITVDYIHTRVLEQWGGLHGTRDDAAIEAAIHRPINKHADAGNGIGLHELAAAYTFGVATAHGYVDGNKRTGWAAASAFLRLNGYQLVAPADVAFRSVMDLVTHVIAEDEFAEALREWMQPLP